MARRAPLHIASGRCDERLLAAEVLLDDDDAAGRGSRLLAASMR